MVYLYDEFVQHYFCRDNLKMKSQDQLEVVSASKLKHNSDVKSKKWLLTDSFSSLK